MSAAFCASGADETLSPSESSVTWIPCLLTASATRNESAISKPATNCELNLLPMEERSQKRRIERLRERAIKADRKTGIHKSCRKIETCGPQSGLLGVAYGNRRIRSELNLTRPANWIGRGSAANPESQLRATLQ